MTDQPIPTRPPSGPEKILQDKFAETIAAQGDQMDALARQLITLELAIPGLFAAVLKLISGDKATIAPGPALYLTFGCWFLALLLTLISLIPKNWKVDPTVLKQGPAGNTDTLGIEDFFRQSAKYKRNRLIAASLLFFGGAVAAAFTIF
jgi:hypothetical protein